MKNKSKWILIASSLAAIVGMALLFRSDPVIMRACDDVDGARREQCFSAAVRKITAQRGPDAALETIGAVFTESTTAGQLCHDLTHIIGQEAYRMYAAGKSIPITEKTQHCSYGFFHGVSEALIAATGDIGEVRKFCEYVVAHSSLLGPDPEYQCYHGLGHGTVNPHDPATWGDASAIVAPAIQLCRAVAQTPSQLESCATGIFAGVAGFFSQGEYGLTVDKANPFWLCREVPLEFREPCFRDMSMLAVVAADGDWREAARFIEAIPEDIYAQPAMRSLGIDLATFDIALCRTLQERLRPFCIQDYVRQVFQDSKPGAEFDQMFTRCLADTLTDEERDTCFRYAFGYLRMYDVAKQRVICQSVPKSEFVGVCNEMIHYE